MRVQGLRLAVVGFLAGASGLLAQAPPPATTPATQPPPATKLEGFRPTAGKIVTLGYDELGRIGGLSGVSVDVRENRDADGVAVRGVVVDVRQSEYRQERAFVDADELPELLRGIDALLDIKANPTKFQMFEVRYETRGELELVAFNEANGKLSYSVQAGRVTVARVWLNANELRRLRGMIDVAQTRLAALGDSR